MPYLMTKSYGGAAGFSCCYRDYRDEESVGGQLHGAVLAFKVILEADKLDGNGRVFPTYDTEKLEEFLDATFGNTVIIAQDDPCMEAFEQLDEDCAIDLVVLQNVSLEGFARAIFEFVHVWLQSTGAEDRVWAHSVEVREHDGLSAIYARDDSVIEIAEDKGDGGSPDVGTGE